MIPETHCLILWLVPRLKELPRDLRFRGRQSSAKNAPVYEEVYVWGANFSKILPFNQLGLALPIATRSSPQLRNAFTALELQTQSQPVSLQGSRMYDFMPLCFAAEEDP